MTRPLDLALDAFGPASPAVRTAARAIDDLRRGWTIRLTDQTAERDILAAPIETLRPDTLAAFQALGPSHVALTQQRAAILRVSTAVEPAVLLPLRPGNTPADLMILADPTLDLAHPLKGPFQAIQSANAHLSGPSVNAALTLLKYSRLLPSALVVAIPKGSGPDVHTLPHEALDDLSAARGAALHPIIETLVQLDGAVDCRIRVFRPEDGSEEHLALIIGSPDINQPTLVRIHSSCLTGDIFGSLRCDCGPQLRGAIETMAQHSGVILYLQQEGRGIGFLNKMRAYTLQHQGHDTVDANEKLGFADDERTYGPASTMLKDLGIADVRLLTNNPKKIAALEKHNVNVVERVAHHYPSNPHNAHYLDTKARRSGHYLPVEPESS